MTFFEKDVYKRQAITVDATVEGSRKVLAAMDINSFTATADVSQCIAGTNSVAVDIKINKNASLASDSTVTVQINVEQLVTESRACLLYTSPDRYGRARSEDNEYSTGKGSNPAGIC